MIYFKQITDYQSEILSDGSVIGTLELLANEYYIIEIDYFEFPVKIEDKRLVKGIIEKVYAKLLSRRMRECRQFREFMDFQTLD
jgi:hypothetical protein